MKSWEKVEIGSFLMERQQRFKPSEANSLGLSRIEKIDFSGMIHVSNHKPTRTDMILVKKNDLVISGINAEKGAVSVYEGGEDVLATIHYSSYEVDKSKVDVEYFKWFLQSQSFLNILKEQAGGGIKTELKPKKLLPLEIYLPDIDTQREIVKGIKEVADEIKELRTINEKNELLSASLRQAILHEAVQGKLVPHEPADEPASELIKRIKAEKEKLIREKKIKKEKPFTPISPDEVPYELPEGWIWVRLNDLIELERGITYGVVKLGLEVSEGVKTLRSSDVKYRKIETSNIRKISKNISDKYSRTILKGGELLITIRGTLGGCAIVPESMKGHNISREIAMIPVLNFVNTRYVLDVLSSPLIQDTTFKNLRGIAYKGLNLSHLREFIIPLPPLREQKRIVTKVDELMKLCDELEEQIRQSKEESERLMQAVLQEAFEGKNVEESNAEMSVA